MFRLKSKSTLVISILIILILLISIISYTKFKNAGSISLKHISSIEIIINPQSTGKIVYTKDKNLKEIEEFYNAFKEAKPADNSLGTTHSHIVIINLTNGDKITVLGGTQGFQTVLMNGKQFNIKGDKLWNYFKQLNK
ncbi:hypothetical protein ciss_12460 [Carboxydothermus islandicus]|uniref:Uncharacterized protein n=1 Tax=Carboxydothermus islandicus TaxID=661089 RepID=A0A1L8D2D1_9THEO|nr:hypothetical protein [Carboxydothermus islandicus]GAV25313.1 hypothetical protein ciss_12460 [Carboxydothermus islandicus]